MGRRRPRCFPLLQPRCMRAHPCPADRSGGRMRRAADAPAAACDRVESWSAPSSSSTRRATSAGLWPVTVAAEADDVRTFASAEEFLRSVTSDASGCVVAPSDVSGQGMRALLEAIRARGLRAAGRRARTRRRRCHRRRIDAGGRGRVPRAAGVRPPVALGRSTTLAPRTGLDRPAAGRPRCSRHRGDRWLHVFALRVSPMVSACAGS